MLDIARKAAACDIDLSAEIFCLDGKEVNLPSKHTSSVKFKIKYVVLSV